MISAKRTFKEFFKINFLIDEAKGLICTKLDSILSEMAIRGDVVKYPIKYDEDDIEFLSHFHPDYHGQAMHQRYEKLSEALNKLFKRRVESGLEELEKEIIHAAKTNNWDNLKKLNVPSDYIEEWKKQFSRKNILGWGENERERESELGENARTVAFEYISQILHHVDEDKEAHDFIFCKNEYDYENQKQIGSNACQEKVIFPVKPFLNRLFHKLERTQGQEHLQGSGLEGKYGQYGFDLFDPITSYRDKNTNKLLDLSDKTEEEKKELLKKVKVDKVTLGFKVPDEKQVKDTINEFKRFQAYQMYGEIPAKAPNGKPIEWHKSKLQDNFLTKQIQNKYENMFLAQLKNENYKAGDMSEISKRARKLAKEEVKKQVQAGNIKGPPSPQFPEGQLFTLDKKGEIVAPDLYLPFYRKVITRKVPAAIPGNKDEIVQKEELVPFYLPANYFRKLNINDYELDEDGKFKMDDNNKPILKPEIQKKLTGYDKQFVKVDHHEYSKGRGDYSKGALDITKNTRGQRHLRKGDPKYQENFEKIICAMNRAKLVFGSGRKGKLGLEEAPRSSDSEDPCKNQADPNKYTVYFDIARGILNCLNSSRCGESTTNDRNALLSDFQSVHDYVYRLMLKNLRESNLFEKEARMQYATNLTGALLQRDWGSGSRRKRLLNSALNSLDKEKTGKKGGVTTGAATVTADDQNKRIAQRDDATEKPLKRGRGEKITQKVSGSEILSSSMNIDQIHIAQRNFEKDLIANKQKLQAFERFRSQSIDDLLGKIATNVNFFRDMQAYLVLLFTEYKYAKPEREAESQMNAWTEEGKSPEQIFDAFKQLQTKLRTGVTPDAEINLNKDQVRSADEIRRIKLIIDGKPAKDDEHHDDKAINLIFKNSDPNALELLKPEKTGTLSWYIKRVIVPLIDEQLDQDVIATALQNYVNQLVRNHEASIAKDSEEETPSTPQPEPVVAPTKPKPPQEKQAARQLVQSKPSVQTQLPAKNYRELYAAKDYIGLANHPEFLKHGNEQALKALLNHFEVKKSVYGPEQLRTAMQNLNDALKRRESQ